jgi:hypothetical protein
MKQLLNLAKLLNQSRTIHQKGGVLKQRHNLPGLIRTREVIPNQTQGLEKAHILVNTRTLKVQDQKNCYLNLPKLLIKLKV